MTDIVPAPVEATADPAADFALTPRTVITAGAGAEQVAQYLGELLRPATGYALPVQPDSQGQPAIALDLGQDARVGAEGYRLRVARQGVTLQANTAAGLFRGVQSLRQLFPSAIEARSVQHRPWTVAGGTVLDHPRFPVRSVMLDVARHFFDVGQVKLYIDQVAQYKINTLHLHLTDDQGWRIEIRSRPELTTVGGATAVGGGPGGFYTQEQYSDLVAYAAARHITVIPEIDMPGHTNAALASYPELTCDGAAVPPRTDTAVGYSSLCVSSPATYRFVEDVVRELAAITPGPYLHIGGDESHATPPADYLTFAQKVQPLVGKYGKKIAGWHEIATTNPPAGTLLQYWGPGGTDADVARRGHDPHVPGEIRLPGHEVRARHPDRPHLGGPDRGRHGLRLGPRDRGGRRRREPDRRGRGAAVDGDRAHQRRHRVPGLPAAAGHRRDRLVPEVEPRLGELPAPAREAEPALGGSGDRLPPLPAGGLEVGTGARLPAGAERVRPARRPTWRRRRARSWLDRSAVTAGLVAVDEDAAFWEDGAALRTALHEPVPRILPVYGYDERGSELFEDITRLPTYYLTRVEWDLLRRHAAADRVAPGGCPLRRAGQRQRQEDPRAAGRRRPPPSGHLPARRRQPRDARVQRGGRPGGAAGTAGAAAVGTVRSCTGLAAGEPRAPTGW